MKTGKIKPGSVSKVGKLDGDSPAKVKTASMTRYSGSSVGTKKGVKMDEVKVTKRSSAVSMGGGTSTSNYGAVTTNKGMKELVAKKIEYSDGTSYNQVVKNNKMKEFQNSKRGERMYNRVSRKINKL